MYLDMYDGDRVWSSRPLEQCSNYQRLVLRWPFMIPRLERIGMLFCAVVAVGLILAALAAGNLANGFDGRFDKAIWAVGALTLFVVVFALPIAHGILKDELLEMRKSDQFRFREMQSVPGFTALVLYGRCLPASHTARPPEVEMVLNRWVLEYSDLDRAYLKFMSDPEKTELERSRYQLKAYEHAFARFKLQPILIPDEFGLICGYELFVMASALEKSLGDEIEAANLTRRQIERDVAGMSNELQQLRVHLSDLGE